jgi:hypothetical protein
VIASQNYSLLGASIDWKLTCGPPLIDSERAIACGSIFPPLTSRGLTVIPTVEANPAIQFLRVKVSITIQIIRPI